MLQQGDILQEQLEEYAGLLKGLAHPVRLALVENLLEREKTSVDTICWLLGISEATAHEHLSKLQAAGAIQEEQDEQGTYYTITTEKVKRLVRLIAQ